MTRRWLILGGLGIAAVALVIGLAVTRASTVVNHTLSFSTAVPTRFAPDPAAFCRTLTTGGGLAHMTQDTSRAGRFNLQVAVITADPRARPAMVALYRHAIHDTEGSRTALVALATVLQEEPCNAQ